MGEVSPETVNGLITAWLNISAFIDTSWPALLAAGIATPGWWLRCRTVDRRRQRQHELDTCNAILHATQTREETDQP